MAEVYKLTIEQGATFPKTFLYLNPDKTPINLTGYTARMQIRETYTSPDYILNLTTGSGITITPLLGQIDLLITATQTTAIEAGEYVYDIELVNGSTVIRFIEGQVVVTPEATK